MQFNVLPKAIALFNASVRISIADGSTVSLWQDPWINGQMADSIASAVLAMVKPRFRRRRVVLDGLDDNAWTQDIEGELSVDAVL